MLRNKEETFCIDDGQQFKRHVFKDFAKPFVRQYMYLLANPLFRKELIN